MDTNTESQSYADIDLRIKQLEIKLKRDMDNKNAWIKKSELEYSKEIDTEKKEKRRMARESMIKDTINPKIAAISAELESKKKQLEALNRSVIGMS